VISSLLAIIQGGGVVTGALVVSYLMVTDRLMGKRSVDRMLADLRARNEYMQSSAVAREATIAALVEQNAKLQLQGELAVALLQSLQSINASADSRPRSGHVAPED
jgi:hypothetical protein